MDELILEDLSTFMNDENLLDEAFGRMDLQETEAEPEKEKESDHSVNDVNDVYDLLAKDEHGPLRIISKHEIPVNGFNIKICALSKRLDGDLEIIDEHRIDPEECEHYGICLDFAIEQRFVSFSCSKCPIFIKNRQSRPKLY